MAGKTKEMYFQELEGILPCSEEELKELFPKAFAGDEKARNRLIEGNLYRVYEAAAYFSHSHARFMDLVQEGNIALMLKISEISAFTDNTESEIDEEIRKAMEAYKASENEAYKAGVELKTRLNVMDEVCVKLAEDLGREPTEEEVAEKMGMDPEDVKYLMKIALSALKREENM